MIYIKMVSYGTEADVLKRLQDELQRFVHNFCVENGQAYVTDVNSQVVGTPTEKKV